MKKESTRIYRDTMQKYYTDWQYFTTVIWPTLMVVEGGAKLHKVEGDRGGWTKYGVSFNNNSEHFYGLPDFKHMTENEAQLLTFAKYYVASGTIYVSPDARDVYFDIAFNMGISRAIKMAQSCIGTKVDGILGPVTRAKLAYLSESCLNEKRKSFYYSLTGLKKFLKGWLWRTKVISEID